jgi:hypothetical protein
VSAELELVGRFDKPPPVRAGFRPLRRAKNGRASSRSGKVGGEVDLAAETETAGAADAEKLLADHLEAHRTVGLIEQLVAELKDVLGAGPRLAPLGVELEAHDVIELGGASLVVALGATSTELGRGIVGVLGV